MKDLKLFMLAFLIIGLISSCDEPSELEQISPSENDPIATDIGNDFVSIEIPDELSSTSDIILVDKIVEILAEAEDDTAISGKIHLMIGEDDLLVYSGISGDFLEKAQLNSNFLIDSNNSELIKGPIGELKNCIQSCKKLPKGRGRRECLATCWLGFLLEAASATGKVLEGIGSLGK